MSVRYRLEQHDETETVEAKIIFMTMHAGVDFAVQALGLGVSGYLLKVDASDEIVRAVKEALAGRLYITPSIAKDVMTALMDKLNLHTTAELTQCAIKRCLISPP